MPVISFVNPKGGAGKSTSALLLAQSLAKEGVDVNVVDADPLGWIADWGQKPGRPENLTVVPCPRGADIVEVIKEAREKTLYTIIDLEGTASIRGTQAVAMSDLAIIPLQNSYLEADAAFKTVTMIRDQGANTPFALLFTRVRSTAISTTSQLNIERELAATDMRVFNTQLIEREAYKRIFWDGGSLHDLPGKIYNLDGAIANALAFAKETVAIIKENLNDIERQA